MRVIQLLMRIVVGKNSQIKLLKFLDHKKNIVFMLWGGYAQKKGSKIRKESHCILNASHPSPLSAHRGFFGCKHFSKANEYLELNGQNPIKWTKLKLKVLILVIFIH